MLVNCPAHLARIVLQWGRRSSRRKTRSARNAAEFLTRALQWGRRSSRRKTPRLLLPLAPRRRASMGPPLIAAEDAQRLWCARAASRCFNGAAAHRGGRPGANLSGTNLTMALQWGRRSSRRKTRAWGRARLDPTPRASMGPPLIAAEDPRWRRDERANGRGFNGAAAHRGGRHGPDWAHGEEAKALQWGRRSSRRKTRTPAPVPARAFAALQWGRRSSRRKTRAPLPVSVYRMRKLQWGRRSSRRKTRCEPEWRSSWTSSLQWGRRSSRRKTHRRSQRISIPPWLQWGRRSSRRKTARTRAVDPRAHGERASMGPPLIAAEDLPQRRSRSPDVDASMGPPLIAAEDVASALDAKPNVSLQWGRRSSRRKTRAGYGVDPIGVRRFNGAAAHRGGRPEQPGALSDQKLALQWGRRSSRRKTRRLLADRSRRRSLASMGPPLIAAEDASVAVGRVRSRFALQWGRRSSRRKTCTGVRRTHRGGARFNGAAAHRGGRRVASVTRASVVSTASMGPPLIAAEDDGACTGPRSDRDASMGPPLIAAEDSATSRVATRRNRSRFNGAAAHRGGRRDGRGARLTLGISRGFNGAAAHRGGRRGVAVASVAASRAASMGPPLIAAEDLPFSAPSQLTRILGFNGAAAHRGGRLALPSPGDRAPIASASMGPPLIAAEDERRAER